MLLRIYGFKTVYTLAGGANVVANCANPQRTEASPWDTNIREQHGDAEHASAVPEGRFER